MSPYTIHFRDLDRTSGELVGGKGANLAALTRLDGLLVPAGFCVTTEAFRDAVRDHDLRADPAALRGAIERAPMPAAIAREIVERLEDRAYAVRSSATAEDSPSASFAGQHDTFLEIRGPARVIEHVRRCWASLFTDRAIAYRRRHGIDPARVRMAVVIQEMVRPEVSGILFTADPLTGNRAVSAIDASPGLGEALVSGHARAETYRVRGGAILSAPPAGILTPADLAALELLGRRIEAHFGAPQDIEWCRAGGELFVVQSRPITTLFPIPEANDGAPHVYLSVGHQQMMTDAMRPFGLSFWLLTAPPTMRTAGNRLFVDVAPLLASPGRTTVSETLGKLDPRIGDALTSIVARGFVPPEEKPVALGAVFAPPPIIANDPAVVAALVARTEASLAALRAEITTRSGPALFDFIVADLPEMKKQLFAPESIAAIRAGMDAAMWIDERVKEWLGDPPASAALSRSAPNNPTSEMGLALLDVADAIRPHPAVVAYLERADDATFWTGLAALAGGEEARAALAAFLATYGARCAGEIDITRPRWAECPTMLVAPLLANVGMFAPGERPRRFAQGQRAAAEAERDLLARLACLPDGAAKAAEMREKIERLRTFIGYREYPKFAHMQRYDAYRTAIRREAAALVAAGVIRAASDLDFLSFDELRDVVRTRVFDPHVVDERRAAFAHHATLAAPRVMTSEGEDISAALRREELPPGALGGLAVSSGVVEGRARVLRRMEDGVLEPGDILVTAFTDPSWTPVFVAIRGLVTEVGGLMTHGAVIAREYGLPAVVSVDGATRRIADGQRIRVNGTAGYVEILSGD